VKRERGMQLIPEAALEQGRQLPFAMICTSDEVYLGPAAKWMGYGALQKHPEVLEEARFFDDRQEIRLFRAERGLQAVCLRGGDCVYDTYWLSQFFVRRMMTQYGLTAEEVGETITLARDLAYDEDGQVYVAATRLVAREEALRD